MRLKKIPISKAKTAWGLLQDVKRAILAEPLRADMGNYINERLPSERGPACGTVGCFAGWVSLLKGGRSSTAAEDHAIWLLGPCNYGTVDSPIPGVGTWVFNAGSGDGICHMKQGTPAYAQAVVARIDRFMQVNEKILKAKKV